MVNYSFGHSRNFFFKGGGSITAIFIDKSAFVDQSFVPLKLFYVLAYYYWYGSYSILGVTDHGFIQSFWLEAE